MQQSACGGVLLVGLGMAAQDAPPQADARPAVPVVDVKPVVVTPTREEEPLLEVPQAISIVDPEKFRKLAPQNTPDALREEPGLVIQSSNQGGGSPILRGRSGKDVVLLIDGQRFTNTTFRRNYQYMNTVDSFALERVEVARGPASVLYGSDAMGGAINMLLHRRDLDVGDGWNGRVWSQFDTVNEGLVNHVDAEAQADGWGAFAGYTWRHFDDLEAGSVGDPIGAVDVDGKQVPTGYREQAMNFVVSRELTEQDVVDLAMLYSRQWNVPTSERVIPNEKEPNPTDLSRVTDPQRLRWWELRWRHVHEGATVETIQAIASLNAPQESRRRVRVASPDVTTIEHDEVFAPGLSLQSGVRWAADHLVTIGAETYLERVDSTSWRYDATANTITKNPTGRYPDGSKYDTYGVFAQDEWQLGDGWEWVNGLRYSRITVDLDFEGLVVGTAGPFGSFDEAFDDVTFASGLSKQLSESASVYGSLSKGFRAPNLDDLAVVGDFAAGNRVPNFDLDPETVINAEIGGNWIDATTRGGLALAVSWYHDLLANQFAFTLAGTNYFQVENSDRAIMYIAEAWLDQVIVEQDDFGLEHSLFTQAFCNFGYNSSANEPLSKVPPPEGLLGWRVRDDGVAGTNGLPTWPWYVETFARGALAQRRLAEADELDPRFPEDGTPAWWTFNVRGGINVAHGVWVLLAVDNLFNYRYRVHGSGIDGPGRNFSLAIDWRF